MDLNIIIPVHNEEGNIIENFKEIKRYVNPLNLKWQITFIDDGSTDSTLNVIKDLHEKQNNVFYIHFKKNFGHQSALKAGIVESQAKYTIMMDGDLQHPPKIIPELIKKAQNGHDVVQALRVDSNIDKNILKTLLSKSFYKVISRLSSINIPPGSADFRLITKKVKNDIKTSNQKNIFWRGFFYWAGYDIGFIHYKAEERNWGKTKYNLDNMIMLAINGIISYSISPLKLAIKIGFTASLLSILYLLYALYIFVFNSKAVPGWTSIVAAITFSSSVQLLVLGVLSEYIGRIFSNTNQKPEYLIYEKRLNNE